MKIYLFNLKLIGKYHHPKLVRERSFQCEDGMLFNNPENIYRLAVNTLHLNTRAEEYVYALCLDTTLQSLQGIFEVSHGSIDCSILSPREVLLRAILCGASKIIIVHNHPSGNTIPSSQDISITKKMWNACNLIGIPLADHIIIGNWYYSFYENFSFIWKTKEE